VLKFKFGSSTFDIFVLLQFKIYSILFFKSEKVPTSGSEILTPKECSNSVDEL